MDEIRDRSVVVDNTSHQFTLRVSRVEMGSLEYTSQILNIFLIFDKYTLNITTNISTYNYYKCTVLVSKVAIIYFLAPNFGILYYL